MTKPAARERFDPGDRIGDYQVEQVLRSEELAVVYEGVHLLLPRRAELKVMHARGAWLRAAAVQLLREACILEALSHLGVPRVYECGVLPDKRPWTASERIEGTTFGATLAQGPIAVAELVGIVRDLADILAHAHERGVTHHRLSEDVILRTPARAFPVCVRNWAGALAHDSQRSAEPSSDVHALGAIAYRALTGSIVTAEASAQQQCPAAPAELTRLIDDMLAPDPKQRPGAAEVRERARWVAETVELVGAARPRWTPVGGVAPDVIAAVTDDEFHVRIKP